MTKAGLKQKPKADSQRPGEKVECREREERVKQQDGKVVHNHNDKELTISWFTWTYWNSEENEYWDDILMVV